MLQRYRRVIAALMLFCSLLFGVQRANAFWDQFGTYGPAIAAAAAGSGGMVTAVAAGGTFLGLTPIGWAGLGLVVLASVLVSGDSSSPTGKTAVVVSTVPLSDDPNPDLASGGFEQVTTAYPVLFQPVKSGTGITYLWFDRQACINNLSSCNGSIPSSMSADWARFQSRLIDYFATYYNITVAYAYYVVASSSSSECNTSTGSSAYAGTGQSCVRIVTTSTSGLGMLTSNNYNWTSGGTGSVHATFRTSTGTPTDCDTSVSYFDYIVGSCVLKTPPATTLNDGICRVSFSDNGDPVFNPFDPDCARAKAKMGLTLVPGTSTTPPKVSVTDPATGKQIITERPVTSTQGIPGAPTIRERTPDPVTNMTTERVTTTRLQPKTPENPTGAPVNTGSSQFTYSGTGTQTSSTPATQVQVTNWPQTVTVTGTVTCTNCTTTSPNVQFPDRMKVDNEGHTEADVPDATAKAGELQARPGTFMDTLKAKINPFASFTPPDHFPECPSIAISWHAWNLNFDVNSNVLCNMLETPDYKVVIQSMMTLLYTVAAIMIILGA